MLFSMLEEWNPVWLQDATRIMRSEWKNGLSVDSLLGCCRVKKQKWSLYYWPWWCKMTWSMTPTYTMSVIFYGGAKTSVDTAGFSYLPARIACTWNKHTHTQTPQTICWCYLYFSSKMISNEESNKSVGSPHKAEMLKKTIHVRWY